MATSLILVSEQESGEYLGLVYLPTSLPPFPAKFSPLALINNQFTWSNLGIYQPAPLELMLQPTGQYALGLTQSGQTYFLSEQNGSFQFNDSPSVYISLSPGQTLRTNDVRTRSFLKVHDLPFQLGRPYLTPLINGVPNPEISQVLIAAPDLPSKSFTEPCRNSDGYQSKCEITSPTVGQILFWILLVFLIILVLVLVSLSLTEFLTYGKFQANKTLNNFSPI